MTPWLALLLLSTSSFAQDKPQVGTLERARRTFAAADSNNDQSLIFGELKMAGLSSRSFRKFDADGSDSWSEADFLLYYEQLVRRGKRELGADFKQEISRIKARRAPAQNQKTAEKARTPKQSGKAVLAIPEKSEPLQKPVKKPAPVTKKRSGQPAPPVVLDPASVPAPKDGSLPPKSKSSNLLERAQKAQRQQNDKAPTRNKRTPG